jgi:hypothetical protein
LDGWFSKPTIRSLFCSDYALDEAWKAGHDAKSHQNLAEEVLTSSSFFLSSGILIASLSQK